MTTPAAAPRPYTLIAELTYRCPLRCPYCSNPVALAESGPELNTATWRRVFTEAAALGVVQLHLTGGEPLTRTDLEQMVAAASSVELYCNLITSGLPADAARLRGLRAAGLMHVQLSLQDVAATSADDIAGTAAHEHKLAVAEWVKQAGLALTLNFVLSRANIEHVDAMIGLAARLGADRLELAPVQVHGWAAPNRDRLLPPARALEQARAQIAQARARHEGQMEIRFVLADYYADRPRACMDGWARSYIHVTPDGRVLPCQAAHTIAGLSWDNVATRALAEIWRDSPALNRFRGDAWMPEPCRSCPEKGIDFGGCRCQAFALLGDAAATDPACALSPQHAVIAAARVRAHDAIPAEWIYRRPPARGR
jgi:pyrroloquinoline quinone biosynthesis protein E